MEENIKIEAQEEGVKEPQDTKVVEKDNSVPFSRFNEVIAERNKLREDMESLNKEKELARAEKLEKDGEYQTLLAEERQKAKDLEEKYNSTNETLIRYETDERNRLLSKLPEDRREKYESVDISTLRNMIEDFGEQPKPNVKQAEAGLQRKTLSENPFKELSNEERKKDWSSVLNSYKK
tara:strand:+ start:776 stop:1312 length:537 start_codon:yes stop_codon:yes gene_type:complete